jgi:ankyrin repeat protein
MNKIFFGLIVVFFGTLAGQPGVLSAQEAASLEPLVRQNVFEVVVKQPKDQGVTYAEDLPLDLLPYSERNSDYQSLGTAFALPGGVFVTAAHVFALERPSLQTEFALRDAAGTVHPVGRVLAYSFWRDFIAFDVPGLTAPGLKSASAAVDSKVYTVGDALGSGVVVRDGLLTSSTPEEWKGAWSYLRFSAAASPGNSGGPLLDAQGRVLGVVLARSANENLNYALPISEVDLSAAAHYDAHYLYSLAVLTGSETVEDHAQWPLPMTVEDLRSRLVATADKDDRRAVAQLKVQSPWSASSLWSFPFAAHLSFLQQHPNSTWTLEAPASPKAAKVDGGELWSGNLLNVQALTLNLTEGGPEAVQDPGHLMDLVLQGTAVTRSFGQKAVRITSLGKPAEAHRWEDRFGRLWFLMRWDVGSANFSEQLLWLPSPTGGWGLLTATPRGAALDAGIDLEAMADYAYVTYGGSVDAWAEFLSHNDVVPRTMRNWAVYCRPDAVFDWDTPAVQLAFDARVVPVHRAGTVYASLGFLPGADAPVWDLGALTYFPNADRQDYVSLFRARAPDAQSSAQEQAVWASLFDRHKSGLSLQRLANNKSFEGFIVPGQDAPDQTTKSLWVGGLTLAAATDQGLVMSGIQELSEKSVVTPQGAEAERGTALPYGPPATKIGGATLQQAIRWNDSELASDFLKGKTDLELPNPWGRRPLQMAISLSEDELAMALVDASADPKAGEPAPLTLAVQNGREQVARELLSRGVPAPATLLGDAVSAGLDKLALDLAVRPEQVNEPDARGWTPLMLALHRHDAATARALLQRLPAGPQGTTNLGWTALDCAAAWCPEMIPDLIASDPSAVNVPTADGTTALMLALRDGSGTRALLDAGASLGSRTKSGWTPLLVALRYGTPGEVASLIPGSSLKARTEDGWGVLSLAARYQPDSLGPLLSALGPDRVKAQVNQATNQGFTPVALARAAGHDEAVPVLVAAGAVSEPPSAAPYGSTTSRSPSPSP